MLIEKELMHILSLENSTRRPNKDNQVIDYVITRLNGMGIKFDTQKNQNGVYNIFSIKEGRPLVSCHTDSMKLTSAADYTLDHEKIISVKKDGNKIVAFRDGKRSVLGGDDGCGIFILLNLLESGADISFAFFSNEEIGMHGSRAFTGEILKGTEIPYGLIFDRKGCNDIICNQNNYGTKRFEKALSNVGVKHGYAPARGYVCDADNLRHFFSCANIGCGYYDTHTCNEYVVFDDVIKAYNFGTDVLKKLGGEKYIACR